MQKAYMAVHGPYSKKKDIYSSCFTFNTIINPSTWVYLRKWLNVLLLHVTRKIIIVNSVIKNMFTI